MTDPRGLVIAAPGSSSGKTLVTLSLLASLRAKGISVAPAKTGPDYIDPHYLSRAADAPCINLEPWGMSTERLKGLAFSHVGGADLLLVEGVMGLFDGANGGTGSTADLAVALNLPVIFVVDAARQSHSIAALVSGFVNWRKDLNVAGIILNRVGSFQHEVMLRRALNPVGVPVLGAVPRVTELVVPERHLGLTMPSEVAGFDKFLETARQTISHHVDLDKLMELTAPLAPAPATQGLAPLGQHIAIAADEAFAFIYPHWLAEWRAKGAEISFFSPLADELPSPTADAVFLPGGYPELHGAKLAAAERFHNGMIAARDRGALIYGECGGFMVLCETLVDADGIAHKMTGLLPGETRIDQPKRTLGYRQLTHNTQLPWPHELTGHEFHYSSSTPGNLPPLFEAKNAVGEGLSPMGAVNGRVMGSYAHVIDVMGA